MGRPGRGPVAATAGVRDTGSPDAYIEFARGAELMPQLFGMSVFETPAADIVARLVQAGHQYDANDPELGYSYLFKDIQLGLWRAAVPDDEADDEGLHFDTLGLGQAGYYG